MKKSILIASLLFLFSLSSISQEYSKQDILNCFWIGDEIRARFSNNDYYFLSSKFGKSRSINRLEELLVSEKYQSGEYDLLSNMYYDRDLELYIFNLICAKWIKNDTDWGLYDYLFVFSIQIDYDINTRTGSVENHKLISTNENLRSWWRHLMLTYRQEAYLRDFWAKKYSFIPPPPPPPASKEWY